MKVYFTASIAQKNLFDKYYERISKALLKEGHDVESGNLLKMTVTSIDRTSQSERERWYKKALKNISSAEIVVVEISFPSTVNVGHELSVALEKGKPVIALYHEGYDPIFLHGLNEDKLYLSPYNENDLEDIVRAGINYALEQTDTRFNFFISPVHQNYLSWVAKEKRVPRAVYLRRLIEEDMKKNKDLTIT